jgi:hypothetical protein
MSSERWIGMGIPVDRWHHCAMHRLRRLGPRGSRVVALLAAVVIAHALLLQFAARAPHGNAARAPALQVRQILVPSQPTPPQPQAMAAVAAAPVAPKTVPAARTPKPHPPRVEQPPQAAPVEAPSVQSIQRPARVPPSTELVFELHSGAHSGAARLTWRADRERYALSLQATLPSGREVEQHSEGGFDAAGLAPLRLADRRRGRDVRAANFQREHGKVTFSGPRWELPLETGTQDRLSWLVQLVAWIGGATDDLRDGTELAMWVVGARGAATYWRFEVRGVQRVQLDAHEAEAWWLVREPAHPYDHRVEVWLSREQGHWPLKLRQTQVPGGEPLEWVLRHHTPIEPGT